MNLRFEILNAVSKNPGATLDDIADAIKYDRAKTGWSVQDCAKNGLLTRKRDDVTGQPGYTLTPAGKARLAEGPDKQTRGAPKAAPAPAVAPVQGDSEGGEPDAPTAATDMSVHFNGFDPMKLPPILISCVARLWPGSDGMFWEQHLEQMPDRIAQFLEEVERQAETVAAKIAIIDEMRGELANATALATQLQTLLDSANHERDGLRAQLDGMVSPEIQSRTPAGYLVRAPKRRPRVVAKQGAAEAAAMAAARNGSGRGDVYALVHIGSAKRGAEWTAAQ